MIPNVALLPDDPRLLLWEHDCFEWDMDDDTGEPTEVEARTSVRLPLGTNGWTVTQRKPLWVAPSIMCHRCGTHGFWRDGFWVPA